MTPSGTLTTMVSFVPYSSNGSQPIGGLVLGPDARLYGTTWHGGANNSGIVFTMTTNGEFATVCSLTGNNADGGGLIVGVDGNLYGSAAGSGSHYSGSIYRIDLQPTIQPVALSSGRLMLNWDTVAGLQYQVQYKSSLNDPIWSDLGALITATNANIAVSDSSGPSPQRFYRVVQLP
jgi:uncharacterized repeat protein (TIGR03803 family)